MESWQKLLLAAGGAAGLAAVLWFLLRDDPEDEKLLLEEKATEEKAAKRRPQDLSKEEVLAILADIVGMQQVMKQNMKKLTKEMAEGELAFEQIYERVKEAQPADPLEKRGLSPDDLDRVLQSSSSDPEILQAVSKIMSPAEPQEGSALTKRAKELTVAQIVEIHTFMLQELQAFIKYFQGLKEEERAKYDKKTVGIVSQAMLDSKVSAKYSLASEDMEGAILANKSKLVSDMKFMQTHLEMQQAMQQFLGPAL